MQHIIHGADAFRDFTTAMTRAPRHTALLCGIDGTIAPIAPTPAEASVPETTRRVLADLVDRLGLVAFITGRALHDGRRMIPLDGAAYVGAHGLESMLPGGVARVEPQAEPYLPLLQELTDRAERELDAQRLGVLVERKPVGFALHYRRAHDREVARREVRTHVVEPARARGLQVMTGHFVIEVRPPVPFTKGTAARRLLEAGRYMAVLVCGDDLTDVTAFRAAHDWSDNDARRSACALAAITRETPQPVKDHADTQVRATPGVAACLRDLLNAAGD